MTDERQPQPPVPQRRGPSTGNVIAGVFLILFAICLLLAGGGCTVLLIALFAESSGQGGFREMIPLLLLSLGVFAGGAVAMWFGVRLVIGKYD
jgi:hypothetical protein